MVDSKQLQDKAKEVLTRDDVRRLIGWKRGTYGYEAAPVVVKDASDVEALIFDATCVQNPASFITLEEKKPVPRGAILRLDAEEGLLKVISAVSPPAREFLKLK